MKCPHCSAGTSPGERGYAYARVHGSGICAPAIRACACGTIDLAAEFAGTPYCKDCRARHERQKDRERAMGLEPRNAP